MKTEISTVIVDDSVASINVLATDLLKYPRFQVIGKFTFAQDAIDFIRNTQPDVLFLDMQMPGKSGLELLVNIAPFVHTDMAVVFYSAHNEYMLDAIRHSAFDFLLKPYDKDALDLIICRILAKLKDGSTRFRESMWHLQTHSTRFRIQTKAGEVLVSDTEVIYFEAGANRRWKMRITDGEVRELKLTTKSKDILKLNESFVRVSRQHIININYLAGIEKRTKRCMFYPPFSDIKHIVLNDTYSDGVMERFGGI